MKILNFFRRKHEPLEIVLEQHGLTVLAARRCAMDLKHAANSIRDVDRSARYMKRAELWLQIFSPGGSAQYRHDLHREIAEKEYMITAYQKILKDHHIADFANNPL